MTRLPVVDLCSEFTDEGTPSERHPKRHRQEAEKAEQAGGMGEIVDVTEDSPQEEGPSARQEDLAEGGSRSWWGELDDPPRWRHGRRRTVLRTAPSELPIPLDSPTPPRPMPWLAPPHAVGSSRPSSGFTERQGSGQHATRSTAAASRRVPPVRHSCTPPIALSEDDTPERIPRADLALARRLQEREDAEAARRATEEAAAASAMDEDMERRIDELEAMEAMENWGAAAEPGYASWPPAPPGQSRPPGSHVPPRARYGQRRGGGWGAASLAEAMMGMLSEAGPLSHMQLGGLQHHMAAVRQALTNPGRLPAHLLFSDRDFDENDYEALLALDDNVKSRKGATTEAIEKIPTVVVPSAGVKADEDSKCPICLEELSPGAVLRRLPCKHHFHKACVDTWLLSKSACPICLQTPCDG